MSKPTVNRDNISYTLLVKIFVRMYKASKKEALAWAETWDKKLIPVVRPLIQAALKKAGYKVKENATD